MRIAYIVPSLDNQAPILVVQTLANVMTQHGHSCCVYHFDDKKELVFPCETQHISFKDQIDFSQYDIVHTHCLRPYIYIVVSGLRFQASKIFHRTPQHNKTCFVMTVHSYISEDLTYERGKIKGWLMTKLFLLACNFHDKIITLSQDAIDYYSKWIRREKLSAIYNCVDIDKKEGLTEEEKTDVLSFKRDGILLGVNCWLKKIKGLDVLIKALNRLPENYKLYIVGDGPERASLESEVNSLGLTNRVKFAGAKMKAFRYLPYFDVFTLTSWSEGFSLSLLEAALYGKPCVSSNLQDIKEKYGENVFYFNMPDELALADAIMKAAGEEGHQKSKQLKLLAEEKFSKEEFYKKHLMVYTRKESCL